MSAALFAALALASSLPATRVVDEQGQIIIRQPLLYYINYTDEYFTNERFAEQFRDAPPDLVHVGKAVPITHHWGPVPVMRGENQYTGGPGHTLNRAAIRLLSPEELEEKIQTIRAGVRRLHEAGVPCVVPYIAYQTIAGDHEKREGFWNFYDHWSAYERWLGPRPPEDPFQWLMRDAQGNFVPGLCGGYSPDYYAPLHRYRVCSNNPHWMNFLNALVRLIAQCGYDGVFVDNVIPGGDTCRYCQERFRAWLKKTLCPEELAKLCDGRPADELRVDDPQVPEELVRRFRIEVVRDDLLALRAAGREVNPKFVIFPNSGSAASCLPVSDGCDFYMWESVYTPGRASSGPLPSSRYVSVQVGEKAAGGEQIVWPVSFHRPEISAELEGQLAFFGRAQVGREVAFTLSISRVGSSNRDDDAVRELALELRHAQTGERQMVAFAPQVAVGGGAYRGARRPPVVLRATWAPPAQGEWRIALRFRYNDLDHQDVAGDVPLALPLIRWGVYRTHINLLLFTLSAGAQMVFLDYDARRPGMEDALELWLAECAAFGNGAAPAALGAPLKKYHRFFKQNRALWDNVRPYAQLGVVYSFWGPNDIAAHRPSHVPAAADVLAAEHRLVTAISDRDLSAGWLRGLCAVYLVAPRYELSSSALVALRRFARDGGTIVLGRATTINGLPAARALGAARAPAALGKGRLALWEAGQPVLCGQALAGDSGLLAGLRFAAYRTASRPQRLLLHAVNYNVLLAEKPARATPVGPVEVSLPLPAGWAGARGVLFSPERERPAQLDVRVEHGVARFTLPKVRIYAVAELTRTS